MAVAWQAAQLPSSLTVLIFSHLGHHLRCPLNLHHQIFIFHKSLDFIQSPREEAGQFLLPLQSSQIRLLDSFFWRRERNLCEIRTIES